MLEEDEYKGQCEICERHEDYCECPECPKCGTVGDPSCYKEPDLGYCSGLFEKKDAKLPL